MLRLRMARRRGAGCRFGYAWLFSRVYAAQPLFLSPPQVEGSREGPVMQKAAAERRATGSYA